MMMFVTVSDPDFEIRGRRSYRPLDKGRGDWSPQISFSALRASVWSKNRGGRGGPAGPLPWIRHCVNSELYLVDVIVTPLD